MTDSAYTCTQGSSSMPNIYRGFSKRSNRSNPEEADSIGRSIIEEINDGKLSKFRSLPHTHRTNDLPQVRLVFSKSLPSDASYGTGEEKLSMKLSSTCKSNSVTDSSSVTQKLDLEICRSFPIKDDISTILDQTTLLLSNKRLISFQKDIVAVTLQTAAIEAKVHQKRHLKSNFDIECIKLRSLYNESQQHQANRQKPISVIGQRTKNIKTIDNSIKSNLSIVDREFLNSRNDTLSMKTHCIMSSWFDVLPSTVEARTWALRK